MELKEALKILKLKVFNTGFAYDKDRQALQTAISHFEILQKVREAGGVKRWLNYQHNEIELGSGAVSSTDLRYNAGWNDCLDAVYAELAGKLEGLEGQIKHWGNDSIVFTGIKDDLIQVIRSHILGTGKKKEKQQIAHNGLRASFSPHSLCGCQHCYCGNGNWNSREHIVCCICGHRTLKNPVSF